MFQWFTGKGRGVVATSDLPPGTLLMVTPPVVLVEGQLGEIPELDEMISLLEDYVKFTPWQASWFKALHRGPNINTPTSSSSSSSSSSGDDVGSLAGVAELPPLMSTSSSSSSSSVNGSSSGSSSGDGSRKRGSSSAAVDMQAGDIALDDLEMEVDEVWRASGVLREHGPRVSGFRV